MLNSSRYFNTSYVGKIRTKYLNIKITTEMKKLSILAASIAALALTSCGNDVKPELTTNVDSLAYDLGVAQATGLKQYMTMQLGVDTAYIEEFIKGMNEGAMNDEDKKKNAYIAGYQVGQRVQMISKGMANDVYAGDSTKTINTKNLLAGIVDGLKGTAKMTAEEAFESYQKGMEPIMNENLAKKFADNKAAGEKFLAENKKKPGVKSLPSGLQYKVIKEGTGAVPTDSSTVTVNYEGRLIDGTVFDSSYERKEPMEFVCNREFIKGWTEAIKMMPAGSVWEVYIPAELAYGSRDMGNIKPFSTLIFKIELLSIK